MASDGGAAGGPILLAGDIGGTKTRLACFRPVAGRLETLAETSVRSREHASLEEIVIPFVAAHPGRIARAGFGVAGPVKDGRCVATNLPWVVDAARLAAVLELPRVALENDLVANAYGISQLGAGDFAVLSPGSPDADGNQAVIAAGTGLGEAGLFWDGHQHRPFASEGGHTDFAPRDPLEQALLDHLRARFGRVSYERVLSGPGLVNVYQFLRDTGRGEEHGWLAEALAAGDPAAAISHAALEGTSDLCRQALELFVTLYGAEAGNLALKVMATGGLYVGGGIAPKILPAIRAGRFMESFWAKGRLRPLMESIPVLVILNDRAALYGAARAAQLAG